jgi:hypothetical protein
MDHHWTPRRVHVDRLQPHANLAVQQRRAPDQRDARPWILHVPSPRALQHSLTVAPQFFCKSSLRGALAVSRTARCLCLALQEHQILGELVQLSEVSLLHLGCGRSLGSHKVALKQASVWGRHGTLRTRPSRSINQFNQIQHAIGPTSTSQSSDTTTATASSTDSPKYSAKVAVLIWLYAFATWKNTIQMRLQTKNQTTKLPPVTAVLVARVRVAQPSICPPRRPPNRVFNNNNNNNNCNQS